MFAARGNILVKRWFDLLSILLNHTGNIAPSYGNIALYAAGHNVQGLSLMLAMHSTSGRKHTEQLNSRTMQCSDEEDQIENCGLQRDDALSKENQCNV